MKSWEEYANTAPNVRRTHYWDLGPSILVGFNRLPEGLQSKTGSISVKKLLGLGGRRKTEDSISYIPVRGVRQKTRKLRIRLPLNLDNLDYVRIYAVMLSEGSFRTEFRLHVPEEVFHGILSSSLRNLLGKQLLHFMHKTKSRNVPRTRFPSAIRYLLPIPERIPRFILHNKEFCREYLRIAFEAEGSPSNSKSKRYIHLVRTTDVSDFTRELDISVGQKVTFGQLKRTHPKLANLVLANPPPTLLGEHLVLLHHFKIQSTVAPESIRRNKTSLRRGKISAKWSLNIYSEDLPRFAHEIGFLPRNKNSRVTKMLKVRGRRRKLSSFNQVIKHLQRGGIFLTKDFASKMREMGYKSPSAYLSRYKKRGLIESTEVGVYRIKTRS
ncbi:MAG: hypothetical protein WED04_08515 [Promethearchaeati archaeon SRVP18_Atabeyarchaeia-1]